MPAAPPASVARAALRGGIVGGLIYVGALALHGEVRAERGCVIDSPVYEVVNGPAMVLAAVGVPIAVEGVGQSPPLGQAPPAGPPFHREALLTAGLGGWAGLGGLLGWLVGARSQRRYAVGDPNRRLT